MLDNVTLAGNVDGLLAGQGQVALQPEEAAKVLPQLFVFEGLR